MQGGDNRGGVNRRTVLQSIGAGAVAAGAIGSSGTAVADDSEDHYHNPVGPKGFGDVSVIQGGDGSYYAYGTENPYDIVPIAKSSDMVDWSYIGAAFTEETRPTWHPSYDDDNPDNNASVWAPDINYHNGQYHLYYSLSNWGSDNAGIGLATADSPDGPFTDQGKVFAEWDDLSPTNCIDQEFVVVDGTPYMIWGSFQGFYGVELTSDGYDYVPDTVFQIGGEIGEGAMMVQENGYYYLFYSAGDCCSGYDSTYEVEVARADSFWGPYYNKHGENIENLSTHHSGAAVLAGDDYYTGPGHNTAYQDENGDWWMIYHVEATEDFGDRIMMIDRIQWNSDDWPVVACDGRPSHESPRPNSGSYECEFGNPIETGTYRVRNSNSGKLLEVAAAGTANGDNVAQWGNTDHATQHWFVEYLGDGIYRFENENSGKVMDVNNASTDDGANVHQWTDVGGDNQRWRINREGNGEFTIEAVHSGKVLDVEGASSEDGANVIQWPENGGTNQYWTFEPL